MSRNSLSFIILANLLFINNATIAMNRSRSSDSINSQISVVVPGDRYNQETPESRRITYLESEAQTNNIALQQLSQQVSCLTELLTKLSSQNNADPSSLIRQPHFELLPYESVEKDLDQFKREDGKSRSTDPNSDYETNH